MKRFYPMFIPMVIEFGPWRGFYTDKWSYAGRASWRHGSAGLGWLKVVW